MNENFPVFTTDNECQDCYKCVRNCSCKAIRIVNARAAVIPERCVCCGSCVRVCPAHAKKIRSDLSRARFMVDNGAAMYASIAPSFVGYFPGITIGRLTAAVKRLGFRWCGETALGAQLVSARTAEFLRSAPPGVYISSACPASVDYIVRYHPEWASAIIPESSPVMAHARLVHRELGPEVKVVFIGPCAAKKNEADRHPEELALALTFPVLRDWLEEEGINPASLSEESPVPAAAEEGRGYSLEGGMNDTIRDEASGIRYTAVSGLSNIDRMLRGLDPAAAAALGGKLFIEVLACPGGCVNGPVMPGDGSNVGVLLRTALTAGRRSSIGREIPVDLALATPSDRLPPEEVSPEKLREALASVGKFSARDELNCGGCGYNTCREFAAAMTGGKAEPSMCLSYLRKISQKTSNALLKCIPAGVVIADKNLQVLECNRNFAEMCGPDVLSAFDTCGHLNGAYLESLIEFSGLFAGVLADGGDVERLNQLYGRRIYNISVFSITPGKTVGAVIQDVTQSELKREQVAERAREVIRKNVVTVQRIAQYLGEHMADTEILLKEVAGSYSEHPGEGGRPSR